VRRITQGSVATHDYGVVGS